MSLRRSNLSLNNHKLNNLCKRALSKWIIMRKSNNSVKCRRISSPWWSTPVCSSYTMKSVGSVLNILLKKSNNLAIGTASWPRSATISSTSLASGSTPWQSSLKLTKTLKTSGNLNAPNVRRRLCNLRLKIYWLLKSLLMLKPVSWTLPSLVIPN